MNASVTRDGKLCRMWTSSSAAGPIAQMLPRFTGGLFIEFLDAYFLLFECAFTTSVPRKLPAINMSTHGLRRQKYL